MKGHKVLLFIASIIVMLMTLSMVYPTDGITLGDKQYNFPTVKSITTTPVDTTPTPEELALRRELTLLNDTIAYYQYLIDSSAYRLWLPSPTYLDAFWARAEASVADSPLRILHYGDSQIEMDRISSRLRSYMQQRFGGMGPGMLPFRTITPTPSVSLSTAGDLTHLSSFGDSTVQRSRGNYGVMMQCFRTNGGASASITATRQRTADSRLKRFTRVSLLYNNRGDNLELTLTDRTHRRTDTKRAGTGVGLTTWRTDTTTTARIGVAGSADLYAILVDGDGGVAVDNIPMRGCSGQQFTLVSQSLLAQAYSHLNVGLIILQFGGNSVPYIKTPAAVSTYCRSLAKQIDHIHQCAPRAQVLFVGPSDMSTRIKGSLQSYPILPMLIDSLAHMATTHGAAYWSIYHAMGGWNSMQDWASRGLAGKDYIHFSQQGADLMGDRLAETLDNSYQYYLLRKRLQRQGQPTQ